MQHNLQLFQTGDLLKLRFSSKIVNHTVSSITSTLQMRTSPFNISCFKPSFCSSSSYIIRGVIEMQSENISILEF